MSIGIYKITNLINNKCYIGQSVHIEKRWYDEKRRAFAENANEYDLPRSRAFRKYGLENFSFEILEECPIDMLNSREQYYIKYYNSITPNGYNITIGGNSSSGVKLNLEKVEEISEALRLTNKSNIELGLIFGVSENLVCGINTGYYWRRADIEYPIRKPHRKIDNHYYCKECGVELKSNKEFCSQCAAKHRRIVNRPDKITLAKEVLEMGYCGVGRKYGVSDTSIRKWCKSYQIPTNKKEMKEWLFLQ